MECEATKMGVMLIKMTLYRYYVKLKLRPSD